MWHCSAHRVEAGQHEVLLHQGLQLLRAYHPQRSNLSNWQTAFRFFGPKNIWLTRPALQMFMVSHLTFLYRTKGGETCTVKRGSYELQRKLHYYSPFHPCLWHAGSSPSILSEPCVVQLLWHISCRPRQGNYELQSSMTLSRSLYPFPC